MHEANAYCPAYNWRSEFRLHCLDMNVLIESTPTPGPITHWLNRDHFYGPMVERVWQDWMKVQNLGAKLPAERLSPDGVIAAMGFEHAKEPDGIAASIAFSVRFAIACSRQSVRAERAAAELRASVRPRSALRA